MSVLVREVPSAARLGGTLVLLSAIAWSLAGPLTKGVSADAWAVLAWRGLFSAVAIMAYVAVRDGGVLREFGRMGWAGWAATTIGSVASVAFILSFKLTTIAHVVVIYGTAPFLAAIVAWIWFRAWTPGRVLAASAVALAGVVVMVGGDAGHGASSLAGDALAVLMTFGMAVMMVMIRRYPTVPMVLAAGVSSVQLLVVGVAAGAWLGGTDPLSIPASEVWTLAAFGLVHAAAVVLLTEGARLIPASETGLLGALEVPLAPVWAWLLLGEVVPLPTLLGGGVVIAALFWHLARRGA